MRFMILRKADEQTEAGVLPSEELLGAMMAYNEELVKAGVMLAGEGLHPSAKGVRLRYAGKEATVTDGPFAEAKELIAGFTVIQAKSKEEAVEWARRWPAIDGDGEVELEVRQMFEPPAGSADARQAARGGDGAGAPAGKRYMALHLIDESAQPPGPPSEEETAAMGALIADGTAAGVLLETGGLLPSAAGARIRFSGGKPTVTDGPFTGSKELLAGYCLYQAPSMEEAVEWSRRFGRVVREGIGEIRPVFEAEDFGAEFTPELREAEERLRTQAAAQR